MISFRKKPVDSGPEPAKEEEFALWDKDFDHKSTHSDFIQMSAEAIQEAMNVASRRRSVDDLIKVSEQWGKLAEFSHDINKSKTPIGFRKED